MVPLADNNITNVSCSDGLMGETTELSRRAQVLDTPRIGRCRTFLRTVITGVWRCKHWTKYFFVPFVSEYSDSELRRKGL